MPLSLHIVCSNVMRGCNSDKVEFNPLACVAFGSGFHSRCSLGVCLLGSFQDWCHWYCGSLLSHDGLVSQYLVVAGLQTGPVCFSLVNPSSCAHDTDRTPAFRKQLPSTVNKLLDQKSTARP